MRWRRSRRRMSYNFDFVLMEDLFGRPAFSWEVRRSRKMWKIKRAKEGPQKINNDTGV